jgi:transcriptional regulator with XRE-family HTH domain
MTPRSHVASPQVANIGAKLRRLRKERQLTQADLARQIGIQQSDLSRIEKGEYRVSLDNLVKLLNVFDVQISEFFGEPSPRSQTMQRPLSREDMQVLHLLRQLSDDGRREAMEFLEFKLRREQQDRRAVSARRDHSESGS